MTALKRKLEYINPFHISVSDNNPRGLSEEQIVNKPEFANLINSIKAYGVLEPLIVKKHVSRKNKYVLIDGERRLRASCKAELSDVPVLVAYNDQDGDILAYQVHMLRENWTKAAETKAIKKIIKDIKKFNPKIEESELQRDLIKITAHSIHDIRDLLFICRHKDEIIDLAVTGQLHTSYLVQIEASFINQLRRFYPDIITKFKEEKIRDILVDKARKQLLGNTRFLMDCFRTVFADTEHRVEIKKILSSFLTAKTKNIEKSLLEYKKLCEPKEKKKPQEPKKKKKPKPSKKDDETKTKETYQDFNISNKEQTQIEDIISDYTKIAAQFSDEEIEYISEAIYCLKENCFKAATLMIWASGISRIISFIENDLNDFNESSQKMKDNSKSCYIHISTKFKTNNICTQDIREECNDKQLISYIYYKNIISSTQCKKLFQNYDTRNDCAHPTDIDIKINEIISIFENIYEHILDKKELK